MKAKYVKPDVRLLQFEPKESIAASQGEDEFIPGLNGSEGYEEW